MTHCREKFTATYQKVSDKETNQEFVKRHSNYYWLGRYLRECVEIFGKTLKKAKEENDGEDPIFYHGVSYLLFTEFNVHWSGALSTSNQLTVVAYIVI